ncbi:hypothetical protein MCNS_24220 [Mycobacterium conspicuum]|uniref:Uncharacterized protein n=2 Tax=Mycobacterium conspicuum TaxID=44010 RepID=A0A1X1T3R1_9MYCO|nr:hypothetical protein AWC00_18740 [Mycobacterium conspicuum]BBZ39359.1 hypothetical protein MCNS_24220 [Mycobacterium conspicuum]
MLLRMNTSHTLKKIFAGALLSGAALTGMAFSLGTAQADPVPPGASGPYTCCPGDESGGLRPQTGRGCPSGVHWDKTQCHTWYGVVWGHGNASPGVWEGGPPPPDALRKPWCGFPFMCSGSP